jgi:hypothetical protein
VVLHRQSRIGIASAQQQDGESERAFRPNHRSVPLDGDSAGSSFR